MKYNNTHSPKLSPGIAQVRPSLISFSGFCMALSLIVSNMAISNDATAQSVIAPPAIGQETKGTPAVAEVPASDSTSVEEDGSAVINENSEEDAPVSGIDSLLGNATIIESRRESGQRYLIELKHSAGTKQYIEETDSDGKIESTSNDIEETPNLPKWKIGSW